MSAVSPNVGPSLQVPELTLLYTQFDQTALDTVQIFPELSSHHYIHLQLLFPQRELVLANRFGSVDL